MGMPPLPAALRRDGGPVRLMRHGRALARTGAGGARGALPVLLAVGRGLRGLAAAAPGAWARTPRERRTPMACLLVMAVTGLFLMPYGPALAVAAVLTAAGWQGRRPAAGPASSGPGEEEAARLQAVYEALVPYLALPDDPGAEPLYAYDGAWDRAFEEFAFGADGRLERLLLRYPAHFRDGEAEQRLRVERLLCAKAGRGA